MGQQDVIRIKAHPHFVGEQAKDAKTHEYVFSYTITIANLSEQRVQLLSRHWLITNGHGKETTVQGEGVIGEQPFIEPGASYTYTSGVILETPVGFMQGRYRFVHTGNQEFEAPIPAFRLSQPGILH